MKFSKQVKPISYLKSHAAEIVKSMTESREPMLIKQNGEAKLVVMDVKSYEEQEETLAFLKILALGNHEIERGMFRPAEDIFAELEGRIKDEFKNRSPTFDSVRSERTQRLYSP